MYRRVLPAVVAVALSACGTPAALPHEEVLERAALAGQRLDSAAFTISFDGLYRGAVDVQTTLKADGVFANGGNALSGTFTARMEREDEGQSSLVAQADVTVLDEVRLYVRFDELTQTPREPGTPAFALSEEVGEWLFFPPYAFEEGERITPDPQFLTAQASVIRVMKDHGFTKENGRYLYHYDVKLDREKFLAMFPQEAEDYAGEIEEMEAEGEMWIDAQNFYVRRVVWHVKGIPLFSEVMDASLDIALHGHNEPQSVRAPAHPKEIDPLLIGLPSPESEEREEDEIDHRDF